MTAQEASSWFENLELDDRSRTIANDALLEIRSRLNFLTEVGLEYLTLDRSAPTLSGGETQRIHLASQLVRISAGSAMSWMNRRLACILATTRCSFLPLND